MPETALDTLAQLSDEELDEYVEVALEAFSKPGTANVSAKDKLKLKGILAHYAKMAHPFSACVRDQVKHGLGEDHANRRCAVLKDIIKGTTKWRGEKKMEDLTVFTLDVPDEWTHEFMTELSDMPDSERSLFERFLEWWRELATYGDGSHCKPGDTVYWMENSEEVSGKVVSVEGDSITVKVGDETYQKKASQVRKGSKAEKETYAEESEAYDVFLSPQLTESAQEVELDGKKLYWKQILPLGKKIEYRDGSYLKTDHEFLSKLAENINSGRYPAPFNISRNGDGHSELADNAAGMITAARVTDKGLDVQIEPRDERGHNLLANFPECPVSAFYAEDYTDKGTKEKVGPRLFHVAATWRPYINEMSAAELVAASDEAPEGAHVVDLSGEQYGTPEDSRKEDEVVPDEAIITEDNREEVEMTEKEEQFVSLEEFTKLQEDYERRLQAAEAKTQAEAHARLSERTLSYIRSKYPNASEAQVRAAHSLITAPGENGQYAVSLSETGEVSLSEEDARGEMVQTLLEGCNSAPKLGEQGSNEDLQKASPYERAKAEAKERGVSLSEVMNEYAVKGEVNI